MDVCAFRRDTSIDTMADGSYTTTDRIDDTVVGLGVPVSGGSWLWQWTWSTAGATRTW